MSIRIPDTYEVISEKRLSDLASDGILLCHKKTKARIALMLNDDENKVFFVGFRTRPEDSTGVAHIIEHTVLCGSDKYPLKDPFVELMKSSLNTYLNAVTYPDKTVYPVASCNDHDFVNLCSIYMDAVFHPNIYKDERIFMQEGWHYELEDNGGKSLREANLKINGVVYNEMKGAMGAADEVLWEEMSAALMPDTTYAVNSGGEPTDIPNLTYEDYLDFHRTYYHPSNSYIYLYGNVDAYERLDWMDREYLSHYDYLEVDSRPQLQPLFDKPRDVRKPYSVLEGDPLKGSTYLSWNALTDIKLNPELYVAMDVIDHALCAAPGAVLRKALLDAGICADVDSQIERNMIQNSYAVIARGSDPDKMDLFKDTIRTTLEKVVKDGFDKDTLLAGISGNEFDFLEADFGRTPKGLIYGFRALQSWLYADDRPWDYLQIGDVFKSLKEKVNTNFFEDLVDRYFLKNNHMTYLTLEPVAGLTAEKEEALAKKLEEIKRSLSDEELQRIKNRQTDLQAWQEKEDSEEAKRSVPRLTLADLKHTEDRLPGELKREGDVNVLYHDIQTNGEICYVRFLFDLDHVPAELYPYVGFLQTLLGKVDTSAHDYAALSNEVNIHTGGITVSTGIYPRSERQSGEEGSYVRVLALQLRVFKSKLQKGFDLVKEILTTSEFVNEGRVKEILDETKENMKSGMSFSGHLVAADTALSHLSPAALDRSVLSGLQFFRALEKLDAEGFIGMRLRGKMMKGVTKLAKILFRRQNMLIDLTAPGSCYADFAGCVLPFAEALFTENVAEGSFRPVPEKKNEAYIDPGQVQYVCRAGNFLQKGLPYTGALRVLRMILSTDYLWSNVRVKGGAYGCSVAFNRSGNSYFYSYRDPNLSATIDVYKKAVDYVKNLDLDEVALTGYIIAAFGALDTPLTPSSKGAAALDHYLAGVSYEELQKNRDEMLAVTNESLRELAKYLEAILESDELVVVGGAEKIEAEKKLFDSVEKLFQDEEVEEAE